MAFLALMILGLALSPLLKVKLLPGRTLPSVTVNYSYGGASAVVSDSEVTSRLEGIFSTLEGMVKMTSRTGDGNGSITLEMEKGADMDAVRFGVSTLIRQVYPELPPGVAYPQIRVSRPDEEERVEQLMSLALNGPGNRWKLGRLAETEVKPVLSQTLSGLSTLTGFTSAVNFRSRCLWGDRLVSVRSFPLCTRTPKQV